MSEMIERVAMAMDPMSAKFVDFFISQGITKEQAIKILPLDKARAAIEAMREPTKQMVLSIAAADWQGSEDLNWSDGWRIMIDAALK